MPKFILERWMNPTEHIHDQALQAQPSLTTADPGNEVRWLESIVTREKVYDIYEAPKAELMMDFASYQGLPIRSLLIITSILKPEHGYDTDAPEKML